MQPGVVSQTFWGLRFRRKCGWLHLAKDAPAVLRCLEYEWTKGIKTEDVIFEVLAEL
jgi:hypothetical protein